VKEKISGILIDRYMHRERERERERMRMIVFDGLPLRDY